MEKLNNIESIKFTKETLLITIDNIMHNDPLTDNMQVPISMNRQTGVNSGFTNMNNNNNN
ncbi:MAG: hypothetical protein RL262_1186, partial [Bacteroidota bacterium]